GHLHVNWREHLLCPLCHLNNRRRASIHLLAEIVHPTEWSYIYATEQWSPLYRHLRRYFPLIQGSEYFVEGSEYLGEAVPIGQEMSEAGFSSVSALCYYSREYGYLGGEQIQFLAEK